MARTSEGHWCCVCSFHEQLCLLEVEIHQEMTSYHVKYRCQQVISPYNLVALQGIEPVFYALKARRLNQWSIGPKEPSC